MMLYFKIIQIVFASLLPAVTNETISIIKEEKEMIATSLSLLAMTKIDCMECKKAVLLVR